MVFNWFSLDLGIEIREFWSRFKVTFVGKLETDTEQVWGRAGIFGVQTRIRLYMGLE